MHGLWPQTLWYADDTWFLLQPRGINNIEFPLYPLFPFFLLRFGHRKSTISSVSTSASFLTLWTFLKTGATSELPEKSFHLGQKITNKWTMTNLFSPCSVREIAGATLILRPEFPNCFCLWFTICAKKTLYSYWKYYEILCYIHFLVLVLVGFSEYPSYISTWLLNKFVKVFELRY